VYPGRYIENVITNGINVTLASLYSVDPLQQYIENTIIDGNLGTCIRVISGETVTVMALPWSTMKTMYSIVQVILEGACS